MLSPMVGRGFLEYMQREQRAGASRPRIFLKLDGDPQIEVLSFRRQPFSRSDYSSVGVGRNGPCDNQVKE